jgi:hypothetical protein
MSRRLKKLQTLVQSEGFTDPGDFGATFVMDGVVPGICMNDGCNEIYNYEPDQNAGWCESCKTQSVVSGLILMGVI